MNCFDYQELISGYLDDELAIEELKDLLKHLEACQSCKENLTCLTLQKEKLISLKAIQFGPLPDLNFSRNVMTKIAQLPSHPEKRKSAFSLPQFKNWLVLPFKRPLYAGVFSFLVLIGVVTGAYLENIISHPQQKKLLSVYELQEKKPLQGPAQFAGFEDDKKEIVFHHVASSSIETLNNEPSLLKYTAYTTPTGNR